MNEEMKYLKVDTAAVVVVARRRAQPLIRQAHGKFLFVFNEGMTYNHTGGET